jgi:NAD-dependent SIR2 family protein deacetylase
MTDGTSDLRIDVTEFLNFYPLRAPRLMWFLGAGSSVGAGLPTAATLTWEFKRTLFCNAQKVSRVRFPDLNDQSFQSLVQSYFDSKGGCPKLRNDEEYSFYFEQLLPDERDRRRLLDDRLSGIRPSYGHFCLAALCALGKVRIIWMTNFDPLVERALLHESLTDSFPGGATVASLECPQKAQDAITDERWPLVVKLHGDYQYRRLKSTTDELKEQDAILQKCLVQQCNNFGLVVVGYSGRDNSVMRSFEEALNGDTPFPQGLFWLIRSGSPPSDRVVSLLQSARATGVQAAYIEIGGFDELMADLFLPHHDEMPIVRDLIKEQRQRRTPVTLSYNGIGWPVIRTNALEVYSFPSTCTLFQAEIGGAKEVKEVVTPHFERLIAARRNTGVIAFGTRQTLEEVFSDYSPSDFDRHPIAPHRLRYTDCAEYGLLYHSVVQGIANATGLLRSTNHKGRILFIPQADWLSDNERRGLSLLNAVAVRRAGPDGPHVHQAIYVSLEYRDERLWLLIEPRFMVTTDGRQAYEGDDRAEIGREELVKRYNRQANEFLHFWITVLVERCGSPLTISFPSGDEKEAVFKVSSVTGFSRRI